MNYNAMLAGALTIAFVTATGTAGQAADAGSKDAAKMHEGVLRTDFSKPQVKCFRETVRGKTSCKGKDRDGYIVDRTTNEFDSAGAYFTTDAQTCHAAGLHTRRG